MRYKPFGEVRWQNGTIPTDRTFTSQLAEPSGLGSLMDYNTREYSPVLGRFLSADTIVPNPGSSQSLNRYSYVENSPLSYIDVDGHVAYPITIRSFAPFKEFGFGFHGDDRSYTTDQSVTSRVTQRVDFDTDRAGVSAPTHCDPSWLVSDPSNTLTDQPRYQVTSPLTELSE